MADRYIGIDLGGTKTEAALVDASGNVLERCRVPTPAGDYTATLNAVADCLARLRHEAGVDGLTVGVCTPGAISPRSGLLMNANSTCLNGRPLQQDLEQALGQPLRLANDADCLAVSESVDGAAVGAGTVFAVILGTGVGGGIVIHGRLLQGPNAVAGEWGHNPLPWPAQDELPGSDCWCGQQGCIETWLSGPGLALDYARHGGESAIRAELVVQQALQGKAAAAECLQRYQHRLARALASIINLIDPEVIVLGGGLSNIDSLYEAVPACWSQWVFSDAVVTRLVRAQHGDSSGVRGAAWLWRERP